MICALYPCFPHLGGETHGDLLPIAADGAFQKGGVSEKLFKNIAFDGVISHGAFLDLFVLTVQEVGGAPGAAGEQFQFPLTQLVLFQIHHLHLDA